MDDHPLEPATHRVAIPARHALDPAGAAARRLPAEAAPPAVAPAVSHLIRWARPARQESRARPPRSVRSRRPAGSLRLAITVVLAATAAIAVSLVAVVTWPVGARPGATSAAARRPALQGGNAFAPGLFLADARRLRPAALAASARAARRAYLAEQARLAAQRRAAAAGQAAQQQAQPPDPAQPPGSPRRIAAAMLAAYGWGAGQFGCLDSLWTQESGWNPSAMNANSGAYGIPQALPGAKMASAGPDWQTDPATQIRWGLGYIQQLYGSPCAAWAHEAATGWY